MQDSYCFLELEEKDGIKKGHTKDLLYLFICFFKNRTKEIMTKYYD